MIGTTIMTDFSSALRPLVWMAVILVVVGLATLILAALRRRLLSSGGTTDGGLTLDDLRGQRDQGLISVGEYEAIRRQLVAKIVTPSRSTRGDAADKLVQARRAS